MKTDKSTFKEDLEKKVKLPIIGIETPIAHVIPLTPIPKKKAKK